VTLSAVFLPPPPVDAANFVQFQSPAQLALEAFPPATAQTTSAPARFALVSNATTAPTPTQQEQLAELNRVLERLGISPQSISLDNRLALIKSANDPPALLNLVRTLGVLENAVPTGRPLIALDANSLSNPAPIGNQTQAPAQNESQAQPQPASTAPLQSSSPPAGPGFGSTSPAGGAASSSADHVALPSNAAAQFQELQAVFQDAGNAQNSSAAGSGATRTSSLSIRV
jgi:hypothetical protein